MSEATNWFGTEVKAPEKKMNHANNFPFFMDYDEEVRICILNADDSRIPPVHYHEIWLDKKPHRVMCTAAELHGGYCPLCEYSAAQPEGERWKTELKQHLAYTILVDKYDGKEPKKCLRFSTSADHQAIQALRETAIKRRNKKGLQYVWIELTRSSAGDKGFKSPKVGKIGQILDDLDVSKYDDEFLAPFSEDPSDPQSLLVQFVYDKDEMQSIYDQVIGSEAKGKKSKIREVN